jgi:hypothetical protein
MLEVARAIGRRNGGHESIDVIHCQSPSRFMNAACGRPKAQRAVAAC